MSNLKFKTLQLHAGRIMPAQLHVAVGIEHIDNSKVDFEQVFASIAQPELI